MWYPKKHYFNPSLVFQATIKYLAFRRTEHPMLASREHKSGKAGNMCCYHTLTINGCKKRVFHIVAGRCNSASMRVKVSKAGWMMYKRKKGLRMDGASEHHETPEYDPRRKKEGIKVQ
jgi:hypothetical protein